MFQIIFTMTWLKTGEQCFVLQHYIYNDVFIQNVTILSTLLL